jgi:hypothetical protein
MAHMPTFVNWVHVFQRLSCVRCNHIMTYEFITDPLIVVIMDMFAPEVTSMTSAARGRHEEFQMKLLNQTISKVISAIPDASIRRTALTFVCQQPASKPYGTVTAVNHDDNLMIVPFLFIPLLASSGAASSTALHARRIAAVAVRLLECGVPSSLYVEASQVTSFRQPSSIWHVVFSRLVPFLDITEIFELPLVKWLINDGIPFDPHPLTNATNMGNIRRILDMVLKNRGMDKYVDFLCSHGVDPYEVGHYHTILYATSFSL